MMSAASFEGIVPMKGNNQAQAASTMHFGSQKGDVYAFSLILYEIMGRNGPWDMKNMTLKDVICKYNIYNRWRNFGQPYVVLSVILNKLRNPEVFGFVRPSVEVGKKWKMVAIFIKLVL